MRHVPKGNKWYKATDKLAVSSQDLFNIGILSRFIQFRNIVGRMIERSDFHGKTFSKYL